VTLTLHEYQRQAVRHLHSTGEPGAGLFLDLGLGKTATVLSALTPDHLPALVLAPKRVAAHVWPHEQALWRPDLTLATALGTPTAREHARAQRADITVMTHDTVGDLVRHPGYQTIVLDELSAYKTKTTQRWRMTAPVARRARHVWGLTGTPAPNGYLDLWAQVALLDRGRRLGPTLTAYRDRYFTPGRRLPYTQVVVEWLPKKGALDAINALLADLCISMSAEDYLAAHHEPTLIEVEVDLPKDARAFYSRLETDLVVTARNATFSAANTAVLSNKLLQVSSGFVYDDLGAAYHLHSEKILAARDIVEQSHRGVIIFYGYTAERDGLLAAFPEARTIDEPGVIANWNAGRVRVLVAHPKSAGHGLNLQYGGHTIVFTTLPWSLELWEQSLGRLARQGQTSGVLVHWLSATPLDKIVMKALLAKEDVQAALLSYLGRKALYEALL
jgi:hypothetical protein